MFNVFLNPQHETLNPKLVPQGIWPTTSVLFQAFTFGRGVISCGPAQTILGLGFSVHGEGFRVSGFRVKGLKHKALQSN